MNWALLFSKRARSKAERDRIEQLIALVDSESRPNLNALMKVARDMTSLSLNVKQLGYELARQMAAALPPAQDTEARHVGMGSKASTQADLEADWAAHWLAQLGIPRVFHRKLWELAYVLQVLYEQGCLVSGARGLGFGCGTEPLPSYFAARGISMMVTDLPEEESSRLAWSATNQHMDTIEKVFHAHLVDRSTFDRLVDLRHVDMNNIPADLQSYDFCWSICALEHLGSIEQGLNFIENALAVLRPGGTAVHTTELNISDEGPTIDNWSTVLFQRRHFEAITRRLEAKGHIVAPLNFDLGNKPLDRFVDIPPFSHQLPPEMNAWTGASAHLKVSIDGFASTCFGISITKGPA